MSTSNGLIYKNPGQSASWQANNGLLTGQNRIVRGAQQKIPLAITEDSLFLPGLSPVEGLDVHARFDGGALSDELWRYLTRRRRTRRALRTRPSRDTIKNRTSIHERPENVNNRSQIGNWEADLIICQRSRPVLVLHERKSRVTLAAKLTGKSAAETAGAIMAIFKRLDPVLRQSITFDNGTEFARHSLLKETLGMATWFCDAYASWQKGGIENANGRLRRWLPRKTNLDEVSDEDIQEIVMTYNLTPRKCLGYITPIQALFQNLGRDVRLTFA